MRNGHLPGAAFALCALLAAQVTCLPGLAASSGAALAASSVLIKAPLSLVWRAVHAERLRNPEVAYSKVLTQSGNTSTIEQKFTNVPIFGSVIAVTSQIEDVNKRIDYTLVQSDRFKAMEGSWEFSPVNGGKETMLTLSSYVDVGVPFSGMFIKNATHKKIKLRLANVKFIAEHEQARVAAGGKAEL